MNIVHVITTINRGGAENQLIQMLEEQKKKGLKINIFYLKGDSYWRDYLKNLGIKVNGPFFEDSNYLNIFKYKRFIREFVSITDPIIHLHMPPSLFVTFIVSFFIKYKKIIYTSHNDEPFMKYVIFEKLFARLLLSRVGFIVCISSSVKDFLKKRYDISSHKLEVIKYGFNKSIYNNTLLKEIDKKIYRDSKIYIGTVARLEEQKRIDLLLKSFALVREENINIELVIIGKGSKKNNLVKLAKDLKINSFINWINYSDNILGHMKFWSAFCLTSAYEGFGLVLLEAIYAKLPIVAMNVSSIKEIVGNCGEVSKFGNYNKFSMNILKVIKNKRDYISKNYLEEFSIESNFKKYLDIYEKC